MGKQEEERKPTKHICVGLLAHVDAGKTTLSERILYLAGRIRKPGRVDTGDTYLDTYEMERARGITIFSKQAVFPLDDWQVTLLDTPGHVDFSAEMERTLQVLDYAILLISGADGVQGHTETLWRLLKRYEIPCFLFVNKMDQEGTDSGKLLAELQSRLDENCLDFGQPPENLWESLAMCEEELLEKYLEEGNIETGQIQSLIARRKVFPCWFGSALRGDGVEDLLKGISGLMCCPDAGKEFGARVFKISRDGQGNRLTHMKITGGELQVKDLLPGKEAEKINQIRIYSGSKYETVKVAEAGMICAVTGPLTTHPGQGLGNVEESKLPVLEPVLSYRIVTPEDCDIHRLIKDLQQLEEEEPQLHIVWNEELQEIHAQVMGEIQIDILKNQIQERFGREVEFDAGNIVYKETILRTVEGVGHFEPLRHYAEVHLLMEPSERGSGLQFDTCCSEDILDRNWQRLILSHLEEKIHRGIRTGAEITDMRITLISGRAHQKHTEGGDFRQATYRAVRQGLREAGCQLLEPYYAFRLEVPGENVGRAMSDLERLKGTFEAPRLEGEMAVLTGSAPVANLRDYQQEVIRYTRGRGRLFCASEGYRPCHNEEEIVAAIGYDAEADLDNPTGSVFCSHGAGFVVPWDQVKDYMHVEGIKRGGLPGEADVLQESAKDERCQRELKDRAASGGLGQGRGEVSFGAEDKELEAIFARTYGEPKRRQAFGDGARQVRYGGEKAEYGKPKEPAAIGKKQEPKEEYLLVDGYNIIYAWEELRELAKETIDGARHQLMDILCNYQAFRQCVLIVVFDAYKVAGNIGHTMNYHNIHVTYTKEAETADQYIEKFAYQMGKNAHVTVATSDGLEQLIIRGAGCMLMSARDLREDIERTKQLIREEQEKLPRGGRISLFQNADEELLQQLEALRPDNSVTTHRQCR